MDAIVLNRSWESVKVVANILLTFALTCVAWVFFRAKTITDALLYLKQMGTNGHFSSQYLANERYNYELLIMVLLFIFVEWNNRTKVEPISGKYQSIKLALCLAAIMALGTYSDYKEFIYFQF